MSNRQRIIGRTRLSQIRLANRGIATPQPIWDEASLFGGAGGLGNIGDITFAPVGFKFPVSGPAANTVQFSTTTNSNLITVTQAAHPHSVGQAVMISGAATPYNASAAVLNGQFLVNSVIDANTWTFLTTGWANATGGAGGAYATVQNLTPASIPASSAAVYQDPLVSWPTSLSISQYSGLFAAQGRLQGKVIQQTAQGGNNAACVVNQSQVWQGQIYSHFGAGANAGRIGKRSNFLGVPALVATIPIYTQGTAARGLLATASYLFQISWSTGPLWYVRTLSSETVFTGSVGYGTSVGSDMPHTAIEVAPGVAILLVGTAGPIYRTANSGASWAAVTSNLSSPAVRVWCAGWMSGSTVYMLGQAMAIAASNDQGVTWTVTTGIPNGAGTLIAPIANNYNSTSPVALDLINRRGYALLNDGSVASFSLDAPTAGFTIESPAGTFNTSPSVRIMVAAGQLYHFTDVGLQPHEGWCAAPVPGPLVWTQFLNSAALTPLTDGMGYTASAPLDLGEGWFGWECTQQSTKPFATAFADGVKLFDRFTLTDPMLPSGRRPFLRVL